MTEREYYLGFSVFPGVGPHTFGKLLAYFKTAKAAWEAESTELLKGGFGKIRAAEFEAFRAKFSIERYAEQLKSKNVSFVILTEAAYPKKLTQITKPPFVLYIKGDMEILHQSSVIASKAKQSQKDGIATSSAHKTEPSPRNDSFSVGIVGTRRITQYGRDVTEMFTRDLVAAGFTIISGLAMGVDGVAHKTTLDNGGTTIAVLGCGVDCCNPSENQRLYDEILEKNGAIISEYPIGSMPNKGTFPSRNRIVAALSDAILVTEGAEDSGSLITAEYGLAFGKKVFAVPGPITSSLSKGPYKLIEKGARLVTKAEDIIKELGIPTSPRLRGTGKNYELMEESNKHSNKFKNLSKDERKTVELLENEALTMDEIVQKTKSSAAKVSSALSLLEIQGVIKTTGSGRFSLAE